MSVLMILLVTVSLAATLTCVVLPRRAAATATVISGLASFAFALAMIPRAAAGGSVVIGFLRTDALSTVFVLATAFLYAATAVYSVGYLGDEAREARESGGEALVGFAHYSRWYYVGINAFCWAMLCAPLMHGLLLLWVAIEITTVVSALLVAIVNTSRATEAAWKYVLIASSGLGIALLATIVMYFAMAHQLPATAVKLAFVLAVVGFGTKVGLFPMHTWLPDAHAEAPTPVSALLSGALLADSFYAILRYYQVALRALGPRFPQTVLLIFGLLSLLLAALTVLQQNDVKRMLAYSSIEHMGILAIGVSFGVKLALFGVLLHVLAHAAAKGNAFMGAGVFVRKYGTKALRRIRGGLRVLPVSAPMFLLAIFALSAIPPFGIFRSEFDIVAGGLAGGHHTGAVLLIVLVTLAFVGLAGSTTRMLYIPEPGDGAAPGDDTARAADTARGGERLARDVEAEASGSVTVETARVRTTRITRGEPSVWMVVPVLAGVAALLLLGLAPPSGLIHLLAQGASELQGGIG